MTPPKTAEERAESVLKGWTEELPGFPKEALKALIAAQIRESNDEVAIHMTQHIENVKSMARQEEHDRIRIQHAEDLLAVEKKARQVALEEAAKVAEGRKFYDPEGFLASAIRALRGKP